MAFEVLSVLSVGVVPDPTMRLVSSNKEANEVKSSLCDNESMTLGLI